MVAGAEYRYNFAVLLLPQQAPDPAFRPLQASRSDVRPSLELFPPPFQTGLSLVAGAESYRTAGRSRYHFLNSPHHLNAKKTT